MTEMRSDPIDREGRQAMPEKWRQLLVVVTSCLCSVPAPRHNWYGIVLYGMVWSIGGKVIVVVVVGFKQEQ